MRQALFLGYGRMGAALGEAWLRAGLLAGIDAVDPGRDGAGLRARLVRGADELPEQAYDLVVLAVKPAMAQQALRAVPPARLARALAFPDDEPDVQ
ncbi:NAD(P)-binding domain-containing protein, partial [Bordetella bronchiseptica]